MIAALDFIEVPDVHEGAFYLEIDPTLGKKRVVYVPNTRKFEPGHLPGGGVAGRGGILRMLDYDPNVKVFVWPDRAPDSVGTIMTPFGEPMRVRELMRESEKNTMIADYQLAHPTVYIETGKNAGRAGGLENMTEQSLYATETVRRGMQGITDANDMTPDQQMTYRTNVRESIMLEMQRDAMNSAIIGSQVAKISSGRTHFSVPGHNGAAKAALRQELFDKANMFELPPGHAVARDVKKAVISNMIEVRTMYKTELASVMGIPREVFEGTTAVSRRVSGKSSSGGSSGGDPSHQNDTIRSTTLLDRSQLAMLFENVWDTLNRASDGHSLATALANVNRSRALVKAHLSKHREAYNTIVEESAMEGEKDSVERDLASEQARFEVLRDDIERIMALPFRVRLRFEQSVSLGTDDIASLMEAGAVSHLERANLMRAQHGLPELTQQQLDANLAEGEDRRVQEAERMAKVEALKRPAPAAPKR